MNDTPTVRPPAVADAFYPADPMKLSQQLRVLLTDAAIQGNAPKALIIPHAGYVYSGALAARAYSKLAPLRWTVRRVVMLCPCHRVAVEGVALPVSGFFDTPLGRVEVDTAAADVLRTLPGVVVDDQPHEQEHAIEVQLPFLQAVLERFYLLPLVVGRISPGHLAALIEKVWGGPETLIVVSSDLSHYHPYQEAQALDKESTARILELVPMLTHEQACGATPINALLQIARRRQMTPALLGVCNSGDTAGSRDRVVGYGAYMFTEKSSVPVENTLIFSTSEEMLGAVLIAQVRAVIDELLGLPVTMPPDDHPQLNAPGACFVTLKIDGMLRGCIGTLEAMRTLREDVRANAVAAASRDPRFTPLTAAEWVRVQVEVSVLSPIRYEPCPDEATALVQIEQGRDGVVLRGDNETHGATFLPAVWRELPEPKDFISHLLKKGGFESWPSDMMLGRYTVREYHEE